MENKEKLYLINWRVVCADEMGFVVSDGKTLELWKKILMDKYNFTLGGTNDDDYYESGQDLLNQCSIKEITKEESNILVKVLSLDTTSPEWFKEVTGQSMRITYGSTAFWGLILWQFWYEGRQRT